LNYDYDLLRIEAKMARLELEKTIGLSWSFMVFAS
jgi:hypothetical protein